MKFAEFRGSGLGSVIAENNSTKYFINVVSTNASQGSLIDNAGVFVNKEKISLENSRGLNVIKMTKDMKFVEHKTFDIFKDYDVQLSVFENYLKDDVDSIMFMFTFDSIQNGPRLNTVFKTLGAGSWCYHQSGKLMFSWSAVYDSKRKNIVSDASASEGATYTASIDYYIDTQNDLGVTGAGNVLIQDPVEYKGKKYIVKQWKGVSPITDFPWISVGELIRVQGDLKHDNEATLNKVSGYLAVQFYDENRAYLRSIIAKSSSEEYKTVITKDVVPVGAKFIEIVFIHSPSSKDDLGEVFCKNVCIQPIEKEVGQKSRFSRFGKYTAPSNEFREGTTTGNTIVKMTNELIEASEMQEISFGEWIKVFEHRTLGQSFMFDSMESAFYSEIPYCYSNMRMLPDLRIKDGSWRMKLVYPQGHIIWNQKHSVEDMSPQEITIIEDTINIPNKAEFIGLFRSTNESFNENTRYQGSSTDRWYYAIGALVAWNKSFPGPGIVVDEVQLYAWKE